MCAGKIRVGLIPHEIGNLIVNKIADRKRHDIDKKLQQITNMNLVSTSQNNKSPEIVGLRPPMCWTFLTGNFYAYPLNILVHFQLLWLHNAYQLKVLLHLLPSFGCHLKEGAEIPNFGVMGVFVCWDFYLSIQRFALSAAVWPEFQCQIVPPLSTPVWGGGGVSVDQEDRKWHQSKCRIHRLATIHNAADRQTTDRAMEKAAYAIAWAA